MDAFGLSFPLAFCDDHALLEAFSYVFFRSIHMSDFYWCCAFSLTDFCLLDCFSINLHLIFSDRVQGIKIPYTWSSLHALLPPRDSDTSQSLHSEQWTWMFQFIHFIMQEVILESGRTPAGKCVGKGNLVADGDGVKAPWRKVTAKEMASGTAAVPG